jgi:aspartyl-tRNA(Asn)/glutamyl-tRNA(Gln) amidotransferase subunit A
MASIVIVKGGVVMNPTELCRLTIAQVGDLLHTQQLSPVDVTQAALDRAEQLNGRYNAFISVFRSEALQAAKEAEGEILQGRYRGPLHGVPLALKDLFATRGQRTTHGSKIFADWVPDFDATVVARLRGAGAIFMGTLNLYQFACGGVMNPPFGPVRNAWDPERIAGGSSSGSGTAIAADMCFGSLGTDTGGSIRIPAVLNGVVGLKPTYGRVSRYGVFPLCWSMDHAGPLTKDVRDSALMLNAIAGYDAKDPTTTKTPVPDYLTALTGEVRGMRIGAPRRYFFEGLQSAVRSAVEQAITHLARLGALVQDVTIDGLEQAPSVLWTIISGDAAIIHERHLRTRAADLDPEVRTLVQLGHLLQATDYLKAQRTRERIRRQIAQALNQVDVLMTPTAPMVTPKLGETTVEIDGHQVPMRPTLRRFTLPFNLSGHPSCTVPCGFSPEGLPIGLQIVGKSFAEALVLRVAHAYECTTDWHRRHPV